MKKDKTTAIEEKAIKLTEDFKFMDFLMTKHMEEEPWVLDDDLPDAFQNWLVGIGPQAIIKYHKQYA